MDDIIQPIDYDRQQQVIEVTDYFRLLAANTLGHELDSISAVFDLSGRAAGMYCVRQDRRWIRYNPYIFAKYFKDNLEQTVPHEVAHYAIDKVYGQRHVRPHGREWKTLMLAMGAQPSRTCDYDLHGIPVRRQNYHPYACACSQYRLTRRRHNRIIRDGVHYYCRKCGQTLIRQEM